MTENIITLACAVNDELHAKPAASCLKVHVSLDCVSPGHALAVATRIGEVTGAEVFHDLDHDWFKVGSVVVFYPTPEEDR